MKKIFCIILTLALLLSGCGSVTPTEPTEASTSTASESVDYWKEITDAAVTVPEYDGKLLIEYDPNREVYIGLSNADTDLYPNTAACISFYVITKECFDPNDFQIHIPIQTSFELMVQDLSSMYGIDSDQESRKLQYYQYLCLQNVDWQEIAQQYEYGQAAHHLGVYSENTEDRDVYHAIREECLSAFHSRESDYEALAVGDVPVFYVYDVWLMFNNAPEFYDEVFESIDITLGEKTYSQNVGQIRLHKETPQEIHAAYTDGTNDGIKIDSVTFGIIRENAYYDGYASLSDSIEFKATEDLTITGLRQIGTQLNIYACRVRITGKPDFYWDMERPLNIEKNDDVVIDFYLKDARFEQYEAKLCNYLVMDYEIRNKACSLVHQSVNERFNNIWDTYLMAFEGYDLGAYYKCYWNRQLLDWTDSLPKKLG